MRPFRRLSLILALAAAMPFGLAPAARAGAMVPVTAADRSLGRAHAPVTVVEYGSFVCSHCAAWHRDVFPAFKARYIDTGRVRLVYRDLPTDPADLATTAAMIGRCAVPGRFFAVADSFFDGQAAMFAGGRTWFSDAIAVSGRSRDEIRACFARPETQAALNADIAGANAAGVQGTPSFFVNGRLMTDSSLASLGAAINAAQRRRR